jgi:hypothetical protein
VFGETLDNNINNFHHTVLDAGLKKMSSSINSTDNSSKFHTKTVMQGLSDLVTKGDIQKAMNAIMPAKRRKTEPGLTMGVHPRQKVAMSTLCPPEIMTDGSDTANTTLDCDEDTLGGETVGEETMGQETVVRCFCLKCTLGDNGLAFRWLNYKPSSVDTKYGGYLGLVESLARRRC